ADGAAVEHKTVGLNAAKAGVGSAADFLHEGGAEIALRAEGGDDLVGGGDIALNIDRHHVCDVVEGGADAEGGDGAVIHEFKFHTVVEGAADGGGDGDVVVRSGGAQD